MKPRIIKCARCGEAVEATGPSQRYCPLCAYQKRLERQARKREESKKELMKARAALFHDALEAARASGKEPPKKKTKRIRCERCGVEVEVPVMAARAKFCPACATASVREKNREYKRRIAASEGGEMMAGHCSHCGKNFSYTYMGKRRTKCDACRKYDEEGCAAGRSASSAWKSAEGSVLFARRRRRRRSSGSFASAGSTKSSGRRKR